MVEASRHVVDRGFALLDEEDGQVQTHLMLSSLLELAHAEVAGEIEIDLAHRSARVRLEVPEVLLTDDSGMDEVLGSHPILPLLRPDVDVAYQRVSDMVGSRAWALNPFRRQLLDPLGLGFAICGAYHVTPWLVRGWGVNRTKEFDDREVDSVRAFEPFLRRAAAERDRRELQSDVQRVLPAGPGVVVAHEGRVIDVDARAAALLSRHQLGPEALLVGLSGAGRGPGLVPSAHGALQVSSQHTPLGRLVLLVQGHDQAFAALVPPGVRPAMTKRQVDVLLALEEGLTAAAIARRLRISSRTVEKHLEATYRKLGVGDRLGAVRQARRHGILPG